MLKFAKYLKAGAQETRSPEEVKQVIDNYIQEKREAGEKPDLSLMQRFLLGTTGLSGLAYYGANKAKQKFNEAAQSYDENR